MDGCARKCVGTVFVSEDITFAEQVQMLSQSVTPTMLSGLFTNAYDNGVLGMYELMTQLLMRAVG
jgi:hypothetical protein